MATLTLTENDEFCFDAEAGEKPIRFIEKFCQHYEGRFAGQPFILHPVQRQIVRDLFGWKWRATGLRRFTDCYFEGAIGSGKSPLLAAIGLYGLMADGERGAQVYSLAMNYQQARVVFECAKLFVKASVELSRRLRCQQFKILHHASNSVWAIVSGKGPGAGCRPSLILGDELHQWASPGGYKDLRDRMGKRRQPLLITATNAPKNLSSFCGQLRAKAVAALNGTGEATLYPIIWAADEDAETDDPEAWHAANPLIGTTIEEYKILRLCDEAMEDDDPEAVPEFRRLYLGVRPTTTIGRWLDLAEWDNCKSNDKPPKESPLYVGVDLSEVDDLCAVVWVWPSPTKFYIDAHFWMPRATAERYLAKESIPYIEWAGIGAMTLLEEPTVSSAARKAIAAAIIEKGKTHKIKATCYDPFKADETIAALEGAGITCVPIRQGYSVSPGCNELDRRLKEKTAAIAPNPVLRFCAENAQVKQDDRGNIWLTKPNAKGTYAGLRGKKIDGITAAVTALTEARKYAFPAASKPYRGDICKV